jgi:hypothetical protein
MAIIKKGMGKPMKKAQNGTVTKKKPAKTYPIISESGDLADALNQYEADKKKGTLPKTDKGAGKYMDNLNNKGKLGPNKPMKMGGAMKKAKVGGEFGALSVKAGVDNNYGITAADRISGAKMNKDKAMKMGGKMAKQAAVAIAMKKAGKTPKKKMQYGGEAASMKPTSMMKKGGMMKKCKSGCY